MTLWLVSIPGLCSDWDFEAIVEAPNRALAEAIIVNRLKGELGRFVNWKLPFLVRPLRTGLPAGWDGVLAEYYREHGCDNVAWRQSSWAGQ